MVITYQYRFISLEFTGASSFKVENLRIVCRVMTQAGPQLGHADILVWGLTLDHINELTTYTGATDGGGTNQLRPGNNVTIFAGDRVNGLRSIFRGLIMGAWPEMQNAPLGPFHIIAQGGAEATTQKAQDTSHDGQVSSRQLLQGLITQIPGATPDLSGMKDKMINSPFLQGSVQHQIAQVLQATGDQAVYQNGMYTVTSAGQHRGGGGHRIAPPYKGPHVVGLVGYPSFTMEGVLVKVEYSHPIFVMDQITIESAITLANGTWTVRKNDYDLESQQPGGHWFLTLEGTRSG